MIEPERLVERSGWGLTRQLLTDACAERAPEAVRKNVHSAVDSTLATLGAGVATLVSLKAGAVSSGVSSAAASSAAASSTALSSTAVSSAALSSAAVSTVVASSTAVATAAVSSVAVSGAAVSVASASGVLSAVVSGVVAKAGLAMVLAGAGYYGATVVSGGQRTSAPAVSEPSLVVETSRAATPEQGRVPRARAAGVTVMTASDEAALEAAVPEGEPTVASVESLPRVDEPGPERDRSGKPGGARPALRTFSSSLGAELALIRKVRVLVAKGDVAGANAALNTYEEQFPEGSLRPEARQLRAQQVRSQLHGTK